jgi:hypothetical protein
MSLMRVRLELARSQSFPEGSPLSPGEYVSITEHDGVQRAFRVLMVTPAS